MSLIPSGLHAVNIGPDSYLDPANTGSLEQLCASNELCMPILSLGTMQVSEIHVGWKKTVEREISTVLTTADA